VEYPSFCTKLITSFSFRPYSEPRYLGWFLEEILLPGQFCLLNIVHSDVSLMPFYCRYKYTEEPSAVEILQYKKAFFVRFEVFTVVKIQAFTLKMEAAWISEMLVSCHTTLYGVTTQNSCIIFYLYFVKCIAYCILFQTNSYKS
jgi:hypothetical protein